MDEGRGGVTRRDEEEGRRGGTRREGQGGRHEEGGARRRDKEGAYYKFYCLEMREREMKKEGRGRDKEEGRGQGRTRTRKEDQPEHIFVDDHEQRGETSSRRFLQAAFSRGHKTKEGIAATCFFWFPVYSDCPPTAL
jgi:hypothetical protein